MSSVLSNTCSEDEKSKIRHHPLMPILQALLNRCEECSFLQKNFAANSPDLVKLIEYMESLEISPETADSSLDDLMWNTAVMLQIFITELEKVEVLTEAFAFKYKAGLKCRLSHTNMCGAPIDSDDDFVTDRDDDPVATLTTPEGTVVVKVPESNLSSSQTFSTDSS